MIRTSIRRPVAIAMTYASVAALGVFAWRNIPIELYPETQLPRLTVSGAWNGASPETVEAFLTSPMEAEIQQVRGVENITSTSSEGRAQISVEFNRDTDMDFARLDLAERIATFQEELPPTVDRITVEPYVPQEFQDQLSPLLRYTFTGPYSQEALYLHLEEVVIPELGQVQGVSLARASGGRERLLEIRVDEHEVAALGLNPGDLSAAIAGLDLVQEAGVVREGDREWTVTFLNRAGSLADIRNTLIVTRGGVTVRVGDVATVHDTFEEANGYNRINGEPALSFEVFKETGANSVRVADAVKARVDDLARLNPFESRFILSYDESEDIREQLTDLRYRALVAAVVIFVVLLIFLGSFRSAAVIFATIAFSVLIALNLIYFGGLSLNLLTLMGLAMGFGLIVDNSIVVLENVFRRWQGGEDAGTAAEEGAREVVLPILASTATTLIVFVPFVYLQGELRVYYVPLAIVVALTLVASIFVAFTFIPGLAARLLAGGGVRRGSYAVASVMGGAFREGGDFASGASSGGGASSGASSGAASGAGAASGGGASSGASSETGASSGAGAASGGGATRSAASAGDRGRAPLYVRFYEALVGFTLRHAWTTVGVTLVCLAGSWYLFDTYVTTGRVWGGFGGATRTRITIDITLDRGDNLARTDQLTRYFEAELERMPAVAEYSSNVTRVRGHIEVLFPDSLEYTAVPVAIKDQLFAYSLTFTGADVYVRGFGPSFYGGGASAPNYSITVLGYNFERVRDIAEDIGRRLLSISRVQDVDTNSSGRFTRDRAMEYRLVVDRGALARHGMDVRDLSARISAFIGGRESSRSMKIGGDEIRFTVKMRDAEEVDVLALQEAMVTTPEGSTIRLGDLMTVQPREVLANIRRENQQYQRSVAYEFRGPRRLGDIYNERVIESTEVPPGYKVEGRETFAWGSDEAQQIYTVLLISILLVYMVTAALFESLRQPLCVLLTVPMALIGVFMIFFYTGATFTREAYIGVIMMGGIVVNNAILLVDHVNRVREVPGMSLQDAILRGTLQRVRPILMTTTTTVLGLLPLVLFSQSADANIWNALGFALIGGLLSSTLFVLTTTPALYYLFERGPAARRHWAEQHRRAAESRAGGRGEDAAPGGVAPARA